MSELTITCDRCKQAVEHICDEKFAEKLMGLLTWVPEGSFASDEIEAAFKAESERQEADARRACSSM